MRARLVPSRRLALLFVLALGACVAAVLGSESARVPLRTPLVPREVRAKPTTVALEGREGRRGSTVYRLELVARDGSELLRHAELQLFLTSGTPGTPLVGAELRLRGQACAFVAPGREGLSARQAVAFRRAEACSGPAVSGPITLDLALELAGYGPVELLAFERPAGAEPTPLQVAPTRLRPAPLDVRGAFVDYPETAPRIVLLAHMWRNSPGVAGLSALVAAALLLACAGCAAFPSRPRDATRAPARSEVLRACVAAFLLAGCLALLHAGLEPPLSGPDEPYHLLGFAELVGDQALAADIVSYMGETHLWRTRQQPGERFRTIDVGRPFLVEDDQLRATEVSMRSAVVARLWRAAAPIARDRPAHHALLALRLLDALAFALAVGAAAALGLMLVAEPFPQWLAFPFLLVPALPFYATHVSETAILCSIYVVLGASVAIVCLDGPRSHWAGLPLGLATGLMLACGRSPWPLTPVVAALLLGRVVLGPADRSRPARAALSFWCGFGLGAAAFVLVWDEPYRLMTETFALRLALSFPETLRSAGLWLLAHQWAAGLLVLLAAALEVALGPLRQWLAERAGAAATRVLPRVAFVLAGLVLLSLLGSLVTSYPQLPLEPQAPMTAWQRADAVLRTMATMFRLTEPNFLLASSFWVGFGWLDTIPGAAFQGLLVGLTGLACAALLFQVGRLCQVRRLLWLVLFAAGAAAALVLYALSTQEMVAALQGRYLIGWYLSVLSVIGSALAFAASPSPRGDDASAGRARAALLLVVAGAAHAYCLSFVLQRYF